MLFLGFTLTALVEGIAQPGSETVVPDTSQMEEMLMSCVELNLKLWECFDQESVTDPTWTEAERKAFCEGKCDTDRMEDSCIELAEALAFMEMEFAGGQDVATLRNARSLNSNPVPNNHNPNYYSTSHNQNAFNQNNQNNDLNVVPLTEANLAAHNGGATSSGGSSSAAANSQYSQATGDSNFEMSDNTELSSASSSANTFGSFAANSEDFSDYGESQLAVPGSPSSSMGNMEIIDVFADDSDSDDEPAQAPSWFSNPITSISNWFSSWRRPSAPSRELRPRISIPRISIPRWG